VRDQVVAAILAGTKTITTGLALASERDGDPGRRLVSSS
jgi:hypothetical protein